VLRELRPLVLALQGLLGLYLAEVAGVGVVEIHVEQLGTKGVIVRYVQGIAAVPQLAALLECLGVRRIA
jgi:hypothetical protein